MIQTYLEMIQVSENVLKLLTITYLCCSMVPVLAGFRKNTVCTVEKHAAFCTLHRDHTVSFVPDADRDMVYGRESKDIIGLLWKPGVPYPGSNQYDMLHL